MLYRKQIKTILQNLFYNVISLAHGEEALSLLEINPHISLVITDYNMPIIDGLELTKIIRKKYKKHLLGILALSEEEEISTIFLKNGANDYIKKPFSKENLTCRVNNIIEMLENSSTLNK